MDHFNKSVSPEQLAIDFQTLRSILQRSPQFGHFLVGPDANGILDHRKAATFLER